MSFPINPRQFGEWCEDTADGTVVRGENMVGEEEIACVLEGVPGEQHEEEVFMTEDGSLVTRDEDATTKFRTEEVDIFLDQSTLHANVILPDESGDIEHIYDI